MSGAGKSVSEGVKMHTATQTDIDKMKRLIHDTKFCMLTTQDKEGALRSRPMGVNGDLECDVNGGCAVLTFFTYKDSAKCEEMNAHGKQVNLSFADPKSQNYVSISGRGNISQDRAEMEKRWNPVMKAWFPDGLDTPGCSLLKVVIDKAEYWDAPSSTMAHAFSFVKSQLTGQIGGGGEHQSVQFKAAAAGTGTAKTEEEKAAGLRKAPEAKMES